MENFYKNRQNEQEKKKEKSCKKGRPKSSKNKKITKKSELEKEVTMIIGGQAASNTKSDNYPPENEESQTVSFNLILTTAEVNDDSTNLYKLRRQVQQ